MRLDDQICFSLATASRSVAALYRPLLEEAGLTQPQYMVMLALWEHSPATIKQIAAAVQLDHGTLTPLLKRLEAAGHLVRRRRTDDERSVEVDLTPQGRALRQQVEAIPGKISQALPLTHEESRHLRELLAKLGGAST
ncbi:MarR family winged helix-turn-helix transcriptional regulator [Nonomuraea gerenzanensis]|uniref:Organic hydroperoxide resistance transcriptional regulator n=1 Tax=Nonomuraea gerenzanensis TaxID=93944 RepID=A0A1M4EDU2_9ACTN|nr:MarR family transcriptional regulator [Nonomuraea gerenzanensis]UBU08786.1 MarR family transcriptional regulator [Nonomuraea gerenzanensis]SBO97151.1 Organic hydroperoxide resistance transcriptional regulator [Nonomuraea gerenzanensis]